MCLWTSDSNLRVLAVSSLKGFLGFLIHKKTTYHEFEDQVLRQTVFFFRRGWSVSLDSCIYGRSCLTHLFLLLLFLLFCLFLLFLLFLLLLSYWMALLIGSSFSFVLEFFSQSEKSGYLTSGCARSICCARCRQANSTLGKEDIWWEEGTLKIPWASGLLYS